MTTRAEGEISPRETSGKRMGPARVGVLDPVPAYRLGLTQGLAHMGLSTEELTDPSSVDPANIDALLIAMDSIEHGEFVGELVVMHTELVVVGIISEPTFDCYVEALRAGATGAVGREAPLEEFLEAVRAALGGHTLLPCDVARALASSREPRFARLNEEEAALLRRLADGATVEELAEETHHSYRTMTRVLHRLYVRLGVQGQRQAVIKAARWGLLN
jgi:DNA-binding NarL/FixJ family response regulator